MTYLTAAVSVLESAGRPLTTREILAAALEAGFLRPATRTPLKSLDAALYVAAHDAPAPVQRLCRPGRRRARRGSVRWTLPPPAA
jgi:hypothetical protein